MALTNCGRRLDSDGDGGGKAAAAAGERGDNAAGAVQWAAAGSKAGDADDAVDNERRRGADGFAPAAAAHSAAPPADISARAISFLAANFDSDGASSFLRWRLPASTSEATAAAAVRLGGGAARAADGLKPRVWRARLHAWRSWGGGNARAARTLCSSGPVHALAIDGCVDAMCCRMMEVLKVLPSRAASTRSVRVENRSALAL
jgi:hypothetical protein